MCSQRSEDAELPGQEDQGRPPGGGKLELTRTKLSRQGPEVLEETERAFGAQCGWSGHALMPALRNEEGWGGFV